ncbi:MAG: MerR family transcriptional regulator [Thermodesulfobacteriota bacterium]
MSNKAQYMISELAEEFQVTTRTIRYYEKRGLLSPSRSNGNYRLFTKKDRTRLKLILRGKRFGYSLEEIGEMIGHWDTEPEEVEQIRKSLGYGDRKLDEIRNKIEELRQLESELLTVRQRLLSRLQQLSRK